MVQHGSTADWPGSHASGSSTSSSLLQRVKARDPEAWQELVKLYGPMVYRWARHTGLQDQDAADVGQEVFQTVAARIGDFRRENPEDSFRAWLWTITRNKLGDLLRRLRSSAQPAGGTTAYEHLQQYAAPSESEPSTGIDPEADLVHRALKLLRMEFEDTTWLAFWQSAVEGRPAVEIAAALGMNPHAVRQAKYRVLRRLRREMDDGVP